MATNWLFGISSRRPSPDRRRGRTPSESDSSGPTSSDQESFTRVSHEDGREPAGASSRPFSPSRISEPRSDIANASARMVPVPESQGEEGISRNSPHRAAYPTGDAAYKDVAKLDSTAASVNTPSRTVPTDGRVDHLDINRDVVKTQNQWQPAKGSEDMAAELRCSYTRINHLSSVIKEARETAEGKEAQYRALYARNRSKRHRIEELEKKLKDQDAEIVQLQQRIGRRDQQLAHIQEQHRHLLHTSQRDKATIDSLVKEREQAAANDLKVDVFDSSVDRVSEAQLVSAVEDVNSSIDEFVSTILDEATLLVTAHPAAVSEAPSFGHIASPLMYEASRLAPGGENWGLLLDCLLHQRIVEFLHREVLSALFGVPLPPDGESEGIAKLYGVVSETENWRATQRWRSVTARALSSKLPEAVWTSVVACVIQDVRSCLAVTSHQPAEAFDGLINTTQSKVGQIVGSARILGIIAATDMVSVRVRTTLGTEKGDSKEVLWPEMNWKESDKDVASYSLGLVKIDEQGNSGVLLKPKVVTEALMRHVMKM